MRKVIFAINNTIDGFADHITVIADDELHDFYTDLLDDVDVILFGRKTYQLMESFWPIAYDDSRSTESMIRFADKINPMQKIVFSKTLSVVKWNKTKLIKGDISKVVEDLKKQNGKNISVGGLSIASYLTNLGLIDEYWFLVQPIILGNRKRLFPGLNERLNLKLVETRKFNSGVVVLHYHKS
jgi:dihydrofolate reductase